MRPTKPRIWMPAHGAQHWLSSCKRNVQTVHCSTQLPRVPPKLHICSTWCGLVCGEVEVAAVTLALHSWPSKAVRRYRHRSQTLPPSGRPSLCVFLAFFLCKKVLKPQFKHVTLIVVLFTESVGSMTFGVDHKEIKHFCSFEVPFGP